MKILRLFWLPAAALPLLAAGCLVNQYSSSPSSTAPSVSVVPVVKSSDASTAAPKTGDAKADEEAEIRKNLAELSPEDRKLAEAQKYCAVNTNDRLGNSEMGVPPVKIMIKDQPVFLCCGGCKKDALKDPDKTLASVAKLKEKAAAEADKKK
jgi:hypothetical protein